MSNKHVDPFDDEYFLTRDSMPETTVGVLEKMFEKYKEKQILDVGCGTGRFVKYFNQQVGYKAVGMDVSWAACQRNRSVQANALKIPFQPDTFEAVICISLIEHLPVDEGGRMLSEIYRVLKKGGLLFVVTPNYASPLRKIMGKKWFGYSDPTHVHFYTPRSMRLLLENSGFGEIKFQLETNKLSRFDWPYAQVLSKSPQPVQYFLNWLLISTHLALVRDSLWCAGKKV